MSRLYRVYEVANHLVETFLVVNHKNDPLLSGTWSEHDRDLVAFLVRITQHAATQMLYSQ